MAHPFTEEHDEFTHVVNFGKYEIPVDPATGERKVLGEGGMGQTYKARDAKLGRLVVLKVISAALHHHPESRKRFLREAKALGILQHPAVPALYEYGEEKGDDFYAMEFIAGEDLQKRISRVDTLSVQDTLNIVEQVARALGAAHRAGIIHRDIKPANLMLSRPLGGGPETVRVIDFGLAKGTGAGADLGQSSTGNPGGYTPLYASPEQCKGEPAVVQSDLYSLGATMWFLLTGRPPFSGTSIYELQKKHVEAPLSLDRLPPSLPEPVRELLERLLAKRPEDRPDTADEVAGQIAMMRKLMGTQPVPPPAFDQSLGEAQTLHRPPTVRREQPSPGHGKLLAGVAAAVAMTAAIGWYGGKSGWFAKPRLLPTPTPTLAPTPVPPRPAATPRPAVTATPRPAPTRTPAPTASPAPQPTATPVPRPTATPPPTPTPRPSGVLGLVGPGQPYENGLGMKFVAVPGIKVLFSIWETRRFDFEVYAREKPYRQLGGVAVLKLRADAKGTRAYDWVIDPAASWERPGFEQSPLHPVVAVSWEEARQFCAWLTERERKAGRIGPKQYYRLPYDIEWSAAVGGSRYSWGDIWPPPERVGNFFDLAAARSLPAISWRNMPMDDGYARTAPVGSFRPNSLGLYDMGGNAAEWCLDEYRPSMNEEAVLKAIPGLAGERPGVRVLRGGAWSNAERERAQSNCHSFSLANYRAVFIGFRVVLADE